MEAFTEKDQFFHGVGVDGVYLPFHKAKPIPLAWNRYRHLSLMT